MGRGTSREAEPVTGVECGYYTANYDGRGYHDTVLTGDIVMCKGDVCVVTAKGTNRHFVSVLRVTKGDCRDERIDKLVPLVSCRYPGKSIARFLAAIPPLIDRCEAVRANTALVAQTVSDDYKLSRQQKNLPLPDKWLRHELLQEIDAMAMAKVIGEMPSSEFNVSFEYTAPHGIN